MQEGKKREATTLRNGRGTTKAGETGISGDDGRLLNTTKTEKGGGGGGKKKKKKDRSGKKEIGKRSRLEAPRGIRQQKSECSQGDINP